MRKKSVTPEKNGNFGNCSKILLFFIYWGTFGCLRRHSEEKKGKWRRIQSLNCTSTTCSSRTYEKQRVLCNASIQRRTLNRTEKKTLRNTGRWRSHSEEYLCLKHLNSKYQKLLIKQNRTTPHTLVHRINKKNQIQRLYPILLP